MRRDVKIQANTTVEEYRCAMGDLGQMLSDPRPSPPKPRNPQVEAEFHQLYTEWKRDTEMLSNLTTVLAHPAYHGILGMGRQALPYIFKDLANGGGPWFAALAAITKAKDVPLPEHRSNSKLMRDDWLKWGRENGYLGA